MRTAKSGPDLRLGDVKLAWENSGNFATLPLVSPRNDVWRTSTKIPHRWGVTKIWVVLLIGWKFASTNQKHYPVLGIDASSVWIFYSRFSDVVSRGNQWWRREMWAFFLRLVWSEPSPFVLYLQFRFLGNCAPPPSLTQHFALSESTC